MKGGAVKGGEAWNKGGWKGWWWGGGGLERAVVGGRGAGKGGEGVGEGERDGEGCGEEGCLGGGKWEW